MTSNDDRLTLEAAALVRGDLPDLRPGACDEIDAALDQALQKVDVEVAAFQVREIADKWKVSARLRAFERELAGGTIADSVHARTVGGFADLPGNPGAGAAAVWTCPQPPLHFRKQQRIEGQDMGSCPTHGISLVRDQPR